MGQHFLFTSESVTMGHPDKVADQISDVVLDTFLAQDPRSRVACETIVTTGIAFVAGEVTSKGTIDLPELVRRTILDIGYNDPETGFDGKCCAVVNALNKQSPDIALGVDSGADKEQGAGDQGMMFGYACDETPELMPLPITLARRLTEGLARLRQEGKVPYLRPDGKSQVTVEYEANRPVRVHTVVVSTQHRPEVDQKTIRADMIEKLIKKMIPAEFLDKNTIYHVNPTGRFVIGGPHGDTGLTGRKIIVDTYGGMGRHGGGAFSGKDPSKVDRSASYAARYIAKNVVAAGFADRCEVQISYAIGVAEPTSVHVNTFGTHKIPESQIDDLVRRNFRLTPRGIIASLNLLRPVYLETARYGHFGRTGAAYTWEKTDKAEILSREAGVRPRASGAPAGAAKPSKAGRNGRPKAALSGRR